MSKLEKLLSTLRNTTDRPESREEFQIELYTLYETDKELYNETMKDMKDLSPQLYREIDDFIFNLNETKKFHQKVEECKTSNVS